jgi:putative ABC transport system permease protein
VLAGRLFPAEWHRTDPHVTVVSANTAKHFWPAGDALGKRIRFERDGAWHEVIGIVGDVNFEVGFGARMNALQAYEPVQETPVQWYSVLVKTSVAPPSLEKPFRAALAEIDSDAVARDIGSVPQMLELFASNRPLITILVTFAGAGLVIAIVGLYGVISQFTYQRRREIGIRIALGATYERVIAMMLAHGGGMLVIGVIAGTAGASAASVLLRQGMPALPALGWPTQLVIGLALAVTGLIACYYPAHRAARLNPVEVLRAE